MSSHAHLFKGLGRRGPSVRCVESVGSFVLFESALSAHLTGLKRTEGVRWLGLPPASSVPLTHSQTTGIDTDIGLVHRPPVGGSN